MRVSLLVLVVASTLLLPSHGHAEEDLDFLQKGAWACKDMVTTRKANAGGQVSDCLVNFQADVPVEVVQKELGYSVTVKDPATGKTYIALPNHMVRMSKKEWERQGRAKDVLVISQRKGSQARQATKDPADGEADKHVHGSNTRFWDLDGFRFQIVRMDPPNDRRKSYKVKYRVVNNTGKPYKSVEFSVEFYNNDTLVNTETVKVSDLDANGIVDKKAYFDGVRHTSMVARMQRAVED